MWRQTSSLTPLCFDPFVFCDPFMFRTHSRSPHSRWGHSSQTLEATETTEDTEGTARRTWGYCHRDETPMYSASVYRLVCKQVTVPSCA